MRLVKYLVDKVVHPLYTQKAEGGRDRFYVGKEERKLCKNASRQPNFFLPTSIFTPYLVITLNPVDFVSRRCLLSLFL